jgi:hypothetical protein
LTNENGKPTPRHPHTRNGRCFTPPTGASAIWTSVVSRFLGYDADSGNYTSHFFESQGHVTVDELIYDDGKWTWSGERIRTTSDFSEDGKVQRSRHEQSEDGVEWRLAMDVTLRKIG